MLDEENQRLSNYLFTDARNDEIKSGLANENH